ncbi:hypothetical protein, partial [Acetobacter orleanensis]|uniref:hypothetical protein n=1 Tax=Acetobacter orleanensis TaxID=104099 RepID=UPI001C534ADD
DILTNVMTKSEIQSDPLKLTTKRPLIQKDTPSAYPSLIFSCQRPKSPNQADQFSRARGRCQPSSRPVKRFLSDQTLTVNTCHETLFQPQKTGKKDSDSGRISAISRINIHPCCDFFKKTLVPLALQPLSYLATTVPPLSRWRKGRSG